MRPFNLLPWREMALRRARRHFRCLLVLAVLVTALLLWPVYLAFARQLEHSRADDRCLQVRLSAFRQQQALATSYQARLQQLEQDWPQLCQWLQQTEAAGALLLQLSALLPEQVVVHSIVYDGDQLWLRGEAHTHQTVATLVHRLAHARPARFAMVTLSYENRSTSDSVRKKSFQVSMRVTAQTGETCVPGLPET